MKTTHYCFLIILSLSLSSCFELVEELSFTDNQKGKYELTLNCSRSRDKLSSLMKLDSFMGVRLPGQYRISQDIDAAKYALEKSPGIKNAHCSMDFNNFIFSISFNFDSVQALNKGILAAMNSASSLMQFKSMGFFGKSSETFERTALPADSLIRSIAGRTDVIELFEDASVTSIIRFNKQVSSASNKDARISKNGTAVMIKHQVKDAILKPQLLYNKISLK